MTQASILVVEDEGIVAEEIKSRLEKAGYAVCGVAHAGEQAVIDAEKKKPDLVLMDIQLKGEMDGIEAAKSIQEHCNIPIVYLTAHSDPATLQRAKVMEPFGYVVKPFETRNLMVSIEIALHRHRSESERMYREKLEAVLETAGAICHELNQPMMAISGNAELLMAVMDPKDPHYDRVSKIRTQMERMSGITRKLMGITCYKTRRYTSGQRIVDLEKSTSVLG